MAPDAMAKAMGKTRLPPTTRQPRLFEMVGCLRHRSCPWRTMFFATTGPTSEYKDRFIHKQRYTLNEKRFCAPQGSRPCTRPMADKMDLSVALPKFRTDALIDSWLASDVPSFDVGGFVVGDRVEEATLLGKSACVIAGVSWAKQVFDRFGTLTQEWYFDDGDQLTPSQADAKTVVARIRGPVRDLLLAERTALNIMSRASGIATLTKSMVVKCGKWKGSIAATRKTTPGFGLVEKSAVLIGGGSTHRMDLSQMTMLKDNHVWSVGSITTAVLKAKKISGFSSKVEVEVRSFEEASEACAAGADVVMLDNYDGIKIRKETPLLKKDYPHVVLEASGGITEETIESYLCDTLDVVSIGKLTQGYSCMDFSMKIVHDESSARKRARRRE